MGELLQNAGSGTDNPCAIEEADGKSFAGGVRVGARRGRADVGGVLRLWGVGAGRVGEAEARERCFGRWGSRPHRESKPLAFTPALSLPALRTSRNTCCC